MTLTATKCNRFTSWCMQSKRHEQLNNRKRSKRQCSSRTKELREPNTLEQESVSEVGTSLRRMLKVIVSDIKIVDVIWGTLSPRSMRIWLTG